MAAVAQKGDKAPLAGMTGYDPSKTDELVQNVEQERQVTPVQRKAKREVSAESARTAKKATGSEMIDALIESGTNRDKMVWARAWLVDNKEATAEQCFRYLAEADLHGDPATSPGTLEKAAKWIWQDRWREELNNGNAPPQEEFDALRKQVAKLSDEVAAKNGELASVRQQLQFAQEQLKEMSGQNALLKKGRDQAEFGPGKNVLEMSGAPA